jgi:hypothetical protein
MSNYPRHTGKENGGMDNGRGGSIEDCNTYPVLEVLKCAKKEHTCLEAMKTVN